MSHHYDLVKERELLYRMIIGQLQYDGLDLVASSLAKCCGLDYTHISRSSRLLEIVKLGLIAEIDGKEPELKTLPGLTPQAEAEAIGVDTTVTRGLDLEYEKDDYGSSPQVIQYETKYVTAHKGPVTSAAFTADGRICATGSSDTSIKIIDVSRMLAKAAQSKLEREVEKGQDEGGGMKGHPVIRTIYDHDLTVNSIDFHPTACILVSGGEDRRLNLFDYTKSTVKKAYKSVHEAEPITDVSIHPGGDFVLCATQHPIVRLYDMNTMQCYISQSPEDQHKGALTGVRYCPGANLYGTTSRDGTWKLWDGVSGRCVNTFAHAHDGAEVSSIRFTKNSKFALTSGKDGSCRLWELSTARQITMYRNANIHPTNKVSAVFNHTEDFVLFVDDKNMSIACWDSRSGEKMRTLPSGHNNQIKSLVHSPNTPAFLSCSEDYRSRFWFVKGQ